MKNTNRRSLPTSCRSSSSVPSPIQSASSRSAGGTARQRAEHREEPQDADHDHEPHAREDVVDDRETTSPGSAPSAGRSSAFASPTSASCRSGSRPSCGTTNTASATTPQTARPASVATAARRPSCGRGGWRPDQEEQCLDAERGNEEHRRRLGEVREQARTRRRARPRAAASARGRSSTTPRP